MATKISGIVEMLVEEALDANNLAKYDKRSDTQYIPGDPPIIEHKPSGVIFRVEHDGKVTLVGSSGGVLDFTEIIKNFITRNTKAKRTIR